MATEGKPTVVFILSLIGGIFILIGGIAKLVLGSVIFAFIFGLAGFIFGIIIIVGGVLINSKPASHTKWVGRLYLSFLLSVFCWIRWILYWIYPRSYRGIIPTV